MERGGEARSRVLLSETARRALAEAEERRRRAASAPLVPKEVNGRDGPEPVRYGDWEVKGDRYRFLTGEDTILEKRPRFRRSLQ